MEGKTRLFMDNSVPGENIMYQVGDSAAIHLIDLRLIDGMLPG
jgi:hypothetical protein